MQRCFCSKEATHLLESMKIEHKADFKAGLLSGGQKRKVSVAIALIGNSQLVGYSSFCKNLTSVFYKKNCFEIKNH